MGERRGVILAALAGIAVAAVVVIGVVALTGDDSDDPCRVPEAAPADQTALMPAEMSFEEVGTVTHVTKDGGTLTVKAVSTQPLDELTVAIQNAVTPAGYTPAGSDNEGDEAEVFFQRGTLAAGQARVEEGECEGQWDIDLTLVGES